MSNQHSISLKTGKEIVFLKAIDILYVKAENIYCHVFLVNGKSFVASHTFKEIVDKLNIPIFFKPHRSYLINTLFIERYTKSDLRVYLKSVQKPIPLSRNLKAEFEKLIL